MMRCLHITVKERSNVARLLETHLPDRESSEKLLGAGAVWLGKQRCLPNQMLGSGDTLRVYLRPGQDEPYELSADDLVYRDRHVLVVCKHAGVPVQGDPASRINHLSHAVWTHLGLHPSWRPAPITRLDQPVSGLVLYGANPFGEKALFALMRQGGIHKWYRARLRGRHGETCRMVDLPLSHQGRRIDVDPAGKPSRTLFIPGAQGEDFQEFSAFPFSGRRHQIRVHAARSLAPIVGDLLYGDSANGEKGIALCCIGLNFVLEGKRYRIRLEKSPFPPLCLDPG